MAKATKQVKFYGIDSWNRPIFKATTASVFFGSTDILFDFGATEAEVLEKVRGDQLEYFGTAFDCEPMGVIPPYDLEIVKE